MAVQLNHTIVEARDQRATVDFLTTILGLERDPPLAQFLPVTTSNDVTLDVMETSQETITPQHYAFLVSEAEFDQIFGRIQRAGLDYWADPAHRRPGEINHNDGGRGVYFDDPNGHNLEILTRPYGGG
jgi:catechol 2,3-dioxygenase-like lactoylglutathione lyase family enzyme